MKRQRIGLLCITSLCLLIARGQVLQRAGYELECGAHYTTGTLNEKWPVRQDVGAGLHYYDSYAGYNNDNVAYTTLNINYFGIKPVFNIVNDRFTFAPGLRYTRMNSMLGKEEITKSDFFYLRGPSEGTVTNYYRVLSINETCHFIGIPLELKYYAFKFRSWGIYLKLATEFNYKLTSKTDIDFFNPSMETYEQEILDGVGVRTSPYYSSLYWSIGAKFGRKNKVNWNLEFLMPSCILSENNSSLVVPESFSGFQFSIQLPVK